MTKSVRDIHIEEFTYDLPDERIAKFPLEKRDDSKLLLYRGGKIGETRFNSLTEYLPEGSLLVFNNTRVIRARLLFRKETGARVEIFCLEPLEPHDYVLVFGERMRCVWTCMVGNLRKWKEGKLVRCVEMDEKTVTVTARRIESIGDTHRIEFTWDDSTVTFAELIEAAGVLPIPPYLNRETEERDLQTYQTVYSKVKGSVAAPTAGLHFTSEVLDALDAKGFRRTELTLHVGAGTFKPVKSTTLEGHEMHTEYISVPRSVIEDIRTDLGRVIAVGTTSVRTLESLYFIGNRLAAGDAPEAEELKVAQWDPYDETNCLLTAEEALSSILRWLDEHGLEMLVASTQIMIVPGYRFRIVNGIITNFHQPQSTLLLLISAFVKGDWKTIYRYAMEHEFRFLSYGDSSLLLEE